MVKVKKVKKKKDARKNNSIKLEKKTAGVALVKIEQGTRNKNRITIYRIDLAHISKEFIII